MTIVILLPNFLQITIATMADTAPARNSELVNSCSIWSLNCKITKAAQNSRIQLDGRFVANIIDSRLTICDIAHKADLTPEVECLLH